MNFERGRDPIRVLDLGMYIYDNGFGPRWYVCNSCKSIKLEIKVKGGFQPPDYFCHDCGHTCGAPIWVNLDSKTGKPYPNSRVIYRDPKTGEVINGK